MKSAIWFRYLFVSNRFEKSEHFQERIIQLTGKHDQLVYALYLATYRKYIGNIYEELKVDLMVSDYSRLYFDFQNRPRLRAFSLTSVATAETWHITGSCQYFAASSSELLLFFPVFNYGFRTLACLFCGLKQCVEWSKEQLTTYWEITMLI